MADLQKKDIGARVHPDTLKALNEICTNFVVEVGKQLMAHRDRQLELQKELSLHPNGVVLPMNDN